MGDDNFYLFKRILQVGPVKHIYSQGQRTPYPIIIEVPRFRDAIMNMGLPEYMPLICTTPLGLAFSYGVTLRLKPQPLFRRRMLFMFWSTQMFFSWYLGVKGSAYKLMGFEDNGLRWKRPDTRLKKYKFTGDLDESAWYRLWRRKGIDLSKQY